MNAFNEDGQTGEVVLKCDNDQSFSLDEQTAELRKKNLPDILNFINKVVK